MARIVTTHYRYKRPPREKNAAALETHAAPANDDQRSAVVTTRRRALLPGKMQKAPAPMPSERKKSAIITSRKQSKLPGKLVSGHVPGAATYEEATAHFRAVIASKLRK